MKEPMLALSSKRVMISGNPKPATLLVSDGKIQEIAEYDWAGDVTARLDVGDELVMAGVVDTHAHINEPGRTDWEGFETATRAAAAGGITTVIDMPLNSIPATTSLASLLEKIKTTEGKCSIDFGFWGGVVPGNAGELKAMVENGARGFKSFLIESGVDEFPMVTEKDLRIALPILAKLGVPLLVHAEVDLGSPSSIASSGGDPRNYQTYLHSRPEEWELEAIRMMIRLSKEMNARVHIVHLSAASAIVEIQAARLAGVPITVETCPHYLSFDAETVPDGATTLKCAPPIRGKANREKLWEGLKSSAIDFVVSDHSPCVPRLKELESGDFSRAWGGIAGLQFSLSAVWTEMRRRGFKLADLTRMMGENPAQFAGLAGRKGKIAVGADADFVIWEPEVSFRVERAKILHKNPQSPYEGRLLYGKVNRTFVRGICVYENGHFPVLPQGQKI
jgi:allantoinase